MKIRIVLDIAVVYLVNVPTLRSCEMYNEVYEERTRGKKLRVEVQRV